MPLVPPAQTILTSGKPPPPSPPLLLNANRRPPFLIAALSAVREAPQHQNDRISFTNPPIAGWSMPTAASFGGDSPGKAALEVAKESGSGSVLVRREKGPIRRLPDHGLRQVQIRAGEKGRKEARKNLTRRSQGGEDALRKIDSHDYQVRIRQARPLPSRTR